MRPARMYVSHCRRVDVGVAIGRHTIFEGVIWVVILTDVVSEKVFCDRYRVIERREVWKRVLIAGC